MTSIQSRIGYSLMKNRHLLKLQLRPEAWDFSTSIEQFRRECEEGAQKAGKIPPGIKIVPVEIDGLPAGLAAEWILPAGAEPTPAGGEPVIFYVHGGGYVSGSCSDHRAVVAKVVQGSGVRALLYEYRLAPEFPVPAALDDTLVAYRWLLAQGFAPAQTLVMGESAGGGLALAALLALRDQGLPLPAAAVSLSPMTDLTLSGESHRTRAQACLSPAGMATVCSAYYAGDHDRRDPYLSPLFGDLRGLPPLLIIVGDYETMRDDATRFAAKAEAAGVDVTLRVGPEMVHCYPLLAPLFPEATEALEEVCAFIQRRVGVVKFL